MADRRGMLGLFAMMLGSLGGSFDPVIAEEKKRQRSEPRSWAKWLLRPSSDENYRVVHGTWYRTWTKRSKKDRAREKRELKRDRLKTAA